MNILFWFIEGQTHFGMPRRPRMGLALNEPEYFALHTKSNTPTMHAPQMERNY